MNYLPFTILAYFFNSIALVVDKFLLTKAVPNPFTYIFYISLVSLLALLLLPFTRVPTASAFSMASFFTILWTAGAYFMFLALRVGQISRVIPVIGTFTPLFLLIYSLQSSTVSINEKWAAGILIAGLILITLDQWFGKIKKNEISFELLSALLFAISYLFLREAYLREDFLTVLVYSRWILIPVGFLVLLIPKLKKQIILKGQKAVFLSGPGLLFVLGQSLGGASQLLLAFSISLTNPALVNSLQGIQYVFLFLASLILAKKLPDFFKKEGSAVFVFFKIAGIFFIGLGLYILAFSSLGQTPAELGVTYSPRYTRELGLNEKTTFIKILDDLKVKRIRIPVYWDEIEPFPQKLNFGSVDFYLFEAQKRQVEVILVIGHKQPRWPECFAPVWVSKLLPEDRGEKVLQLLAKEVTHFKQFPNVVAWQVENEPSLSFGVCDPVNQQTFNLLKKEVEMVKGLDQRPVLITDSGELSLWTGSIIYSDWFGTTLYRTVWSKYFGVIDYPLPPIFYSLKEKIVRGLTGKRGLTIISELQAEPWIIKRARVVDTNVEEQAKLLPVAKLESNVRYAQEIGFSQIYLWGVEWWYYMAQNGHPQYLEYAKGLFR